MAGVRQHLILASAALFLCVGCADNRSVSRSERAEQAAAELYGPPSSDATAIVEGGVTREEYDAATEAFAACMLAAGYDIGPITPDPLYPLNRANIPVAAQDTGVYDRCYGSEFAAIDMQWQAQMWDYFDAHPTEDPAYADNATCAAKNNIEIPDGATADDILKLLISKGVVDTCGYNPPTSQP